MTREEFDRLLEEQDRLNQIHQIRRDNQSLATFARLTRKLCDQFRWEIATDEISHPHTRED